MPAFPSLAPTALSLRESIFARMAGRLSAHGAHAIALHIGDTHRPPPTGARLSLRSDLDDPALFRYGAPGGEPALLEALSAKCHLRNGLAWVNRDSILVTVGATAGVSAAVRALFAPGDELLLFSPYWPLVHGITTSAGVVPREVDVSQALYADPAIDVQVLVEAALTPRTRGLYLVTPNNPDGKVLDRRALEAVARVARERDLWVIADEVYEDVVYTGTHVSLAALPGMAERTVTVYSFSKSLALAGYRLGYVVADPRVVSVLRKLHNHGVYNVPVVLQRAALAALDDRAWLDQTLSAYRQVRDAASARLPAPHALPDGGAYLFVDLSPWLPPAAMPLRDGEMDPVLALHERFLDAGVAIAPGRSFGASWDRHARLCYTSLPPERVLEGVERIAAVLDDVGRVGPGPLPSLPPAR